MAERGYLADRGDERADLGDRTGTRSGRGSGVVHGDSRGVVHGDSRHDDAAAVDDGVGDRDGDRAPGRDGALAGDRVDRSDTDRYELVAVDHPVLVERFRSAPRVGTGTDGLGDAPALSADELRVLFLQHNELFERAPAIPASTDDGAAPVATVPDADEVAESTASPVADGPDDGPTLSTDQVAGLRRRWGAVQAGFVDDPRRAVEIADDIVAEAVGALQAAIDDRRREVAEPWREDADASTDALLVAFQSYRSVFERVLSS